MPLKVHDTDKLKSPPAKTPARKNKQEPDAPETPRDVEVRYGIKRKAKLDTAADQTDRQEYDADGLQRMTKYTVDKR